MPKLLKRLLSLVALSYAVLRGGHSTRVTRRSCFTKGRWSSFMKALPQG